MKLLRKSKNAKAYRQDIRELQEKGDLRAIDTSVLVVAAEFKKHPEYQVSLRNTQELLQTEMEKSEKEIRKQALWRTLRMFLSTFRTSETC